MRPVVRLKVVLARVALVEPRAWVTSITVAVAVMQGRVRLKSCKVDPAVRAFGVVAAVVPRIQTATPLLQAAMVLHMVQVAAVLVPKIRRLARRLVQLYPVDRACLWSHHGSCQ